MPAQLFDVSPRGSSSYSVPTFSGLQRGLSDLGAGIGAGITQRRTKREEEERKRMERAALQAAFGTYGEGGREAVTAGIRSGAIDPAMMERLWPIMQADQAQRNADRTFGLQQRRFNAEQAARAARAAQAPERKIMEDAAGRKRYVDTGEYVFDGVRVPEEDDLPTSVREYEYAKAEGFEGSFNDFRNRVQRVEQGTPGQFASLSKEQTGQRNQAQATLDRWNAIRPRLEGGSQFLTAKGRTANRLLGAADKLGVNIGEDGKTWLGESAKFRQTVQKELSQFINDMSGAAVSEQEAERLKLAIPNLDDSPVEFLAKMEQTIESLDAIAQGGALAPAAAPENPIDTVTRAAAEAVSNPIAAPAMAATNPAAVTADATPPAVGGYDLPDLSAMTDANQVQAEVFKILQTPGMDPAEATRLIDQLEARAKELRNSEDSRLERIWKSIFGG